MGLACRPWNIFLACEPSPGAFQLSVAGQLVDKWCAGPQPINNVVSFRRPEDFKDYVVESEFECNSGFSWKTI